LIGRIVAVVDGLVVGAMADPVAGKKRGRP
jgi:hypothetical protein